MSYYLCRTKGRTDVFPKSISVKWNKNKFEQDLKSFRRSHFPQQEHYIKYACRRVSII